MADRWLPSILTFALWAGVALCASFWALRFTGSAASPLPPVAPVAAPAPGGDTADLVRVFGPPVAVAPAPVASAPAPVDLGRRFALVGVVANRAANRGVALIAIDGKAARPYRVGSAVDVGYTLQKVEKRSATLSPTSAGGAELTLELAAPRADGAATATPGSTPAPAPAPAPAPGTAPVQPLPAGPLLRPAR